MATAPGGGRQDRGCRVPFKFQYGYLATTGDKLLVFERRVPGDSRVEQIICQASWFWGDPRILPLAKALAARDEKVGGMGGTIPYDVSLRKPRHHYFMDDARAVLAAMDKSVTS